MVSHLLSFVIFTPIVALILILIIPQEYKKTYKFINLASAVIQLLFSILIVKAFNPNIPGLQLVERYQWITLPLGEIGKANINYFLGVDGLNVGLVVLSSIVITIASLSSFKIEKNSKGYFSLFLILSSSTVGCFVSLDFFLFYLFFELLLLPMYFLIGLWGGPRREYASIKFFLYTLFGSIFILIVILALFFSVIDPALTAVEIGLASDINSATPTVILNVQEMLANGRIPLSSQVHTFNIPDMGDIKNYIPGRILSLDSDWWFWGLPARLVAFLALFIGFAIKLPMVPVHTWLPDAHVEAPTPISVVLAGVLLKVGGYGLLRTSYFIFPEGALHFAWLIGLLGVITIIYAGFNALAMKDLKKLIAYSSVSHMGFVLLGLASVTALGINGSIYQMISHGILSSLAFVIAGVIYDRTGDRIIDHYKGLASKMPIYTTVVTVSFFASLGLPGFSGFIAELFVLLGAFNSSSINALLPKWMAIAATFGIFLGAAYYLWTLQRMFFGKFSLDVSLHQHQPLSDLSPMEKTILFPLVGLSIILGLFPSLIFNLTSPFVGQFVEYVMQVGNTHLQQIK